MAKAGRLFIQLDVNWYEEWGHLLSDEAALLWIVGACASKRMLSDGRLTMAQLRRVAPESQTSSPDRLQRAVTELCEADEVPLEMDGQDVVYRGWAAWNDLASDVEAMSEGGRFGNHVKWHVKKKKSSPDCEFCCPSPPDSAPDSAPESQSREDTETDTDTELVSSSRVAAPSVPPTTPASAKPKPKPSKPRLTPVPIEFPIDASLRKWAQDHGLGHVDLEAETELFLNHHGAKGSMMADWRRAWFTWMGRIKPFQAARSSAPVRNAPVSDRNRDRIRAAADVMRRNAAPDAPVAQIGDGR